MLLEHCQQLFCGQNAMWWPHLGWLATPLSRDWITSEPAQQAVHCDHHSHTLFGRNVTNTSMHCLELRYEPGRFYLFNNQVPHTVINLDVNRYLFSLEFAESLSYFDLKQRFTDAGLLEPQTNVP